MNRIGHPEDAAQRVTRSQCRFRSYLAHIMSMTPVYVVQNINTPVSMISLLGIIKVSSKISKMTLKIERRW